MHYIYMVRCADGSLYTGYALDPVKRVAAHNAGKGAKYTRSRLPVELVYTEQYETATEAHRREWQIKQLSHAMKEAMLAEKFGENE